MRPLRNEIFELDLLPELFAVSKLNPWEALPAWALKSSLFSITRTPDELSIVCAQAKVPKQVRSEPDWRVLRIRGKLDFSLVGVLSSLIVSLAEIEISVFVLSTYDADHLLIKSESLDMAVSALSRVGYLIHQPGQE